MDEVGALHAAGWAPLVGLLLSVGGSRSDAEEVAQGAYEKLVRAWPRIGTYDDPQAWVRTVAVRDLISRHRRSRVARLKRSAVASPEWTDGAVGSVADRVDVREAMATLSVDHRAALLLHHVEDLPVAEVARVLDVSVGTVKSRLSRARAQLTAQLTVPAEETS